MKTQFKNSPQRLHREYNCRNCDICRTIRSGEIGPSAGQEDDIQTIMELLDNAHDRNSRDAKNFSALAFPAGPLIIVGEILPLKFFAAWMIKNIPAKVHQEILSVVCLKCEKSFRDFLIAGKIECSDCDATFSPFIKSVIQLMLKGKNQG